MQTSKHHCYNISDDETFLQMNLSLMQSDFFKSLVMLGYKVMATELVSIQ